MMRLRLEVVIYKPRRMASRVNNPAHTLTSQLLVSRTVRKFSVVKATQSLIQYFVLAALSE